MDKNIDLYFKLDENILDGKQYLASLIYAAYSKSFLSIGEAERIQTELSALLCKIILSYTKGKSSSVREEIAKQLMESEMYVIGLALKGLGNAENTLKQIKTAFSARELFDNGLKTVKAKLKVCRLYKESICRNMFKTKNVFYSSTLKDGIDAFFKNYNPLFNAQSNVITADYPTFMQVNNLCGVEFIERYLKYAECENSFLCKFNSDVAESLFLHYSKDYENEPISLFELVFTNALGVILSGKSPTERLIMSKEDSERVWSMFDYPDKDKINELLTKACDKLSESLSLSQRVRKYTALCTPLVSEKIYAYKSKGLDSIFISENTVKFTCDEKVLDETRLSYLGYNALLEEIQRCETPKQRAEKLLSGVSGTEDFFGLVHDAEFDSDDISALVEAMQPDEFAMIYSKLTRNILNQETQQRLLDCMKQHIGKK